jgi:hypothetical protein
MCVFILSMLAWLVAVFKEKRYEVFLKRVARPADRRLWNKQEQLQKQAMPPT